MLKKLKMKFVLINMCLIGIVLMIAFSVICINTYEKERLEVRKAMSAEFERNVHENILVEIGKDPQNVNKNGFGPIKPGEPDSVRAGKPFHYAVVLVEAKENGGEISAKTIVMREAFMKAEVIDEATKAVLAEGKEEGKLKKLGLFYMVDSKGAETRIAFADSTYFDEKMSKTIVTSTVIFVITLLAMFFISLLLAKVAVTPVKKAWEQQHRFIADASHELKTPLTVMLANNEIMMSAVEEGAELNEVNKWIKNSQEEATYMKALVEDLLFLAREDEAGDIVNDRRKISKEKTDISRLVTGVSLQMEPVIFEAGLEFEVQVDEGIVLDCDPNQIKQLVHILLDNAVKYCDKSGRVWLSLKRISGGVVLEVINTGEPIEKDELEHIFERFYRTDKARTGSGYGLGLSIAKTIAERHGGEITARSGIKETPDGKAGTVMNIVIKK